MNETVEDGIGECGVSDHLMPIVGRNMAGDECGAAVIAVFNNLKEVPSLLGSAFALWLSLQDVRIVKRRGQNSIAKVVGNSSQKRWTISSASGMQRGAFAQTADISEASF